MAWAIMSAMASGGKPHPVACSYAWAGVSRPYHTAYMMTAVRLLGLNGGGGTLASRRTADRQSASHLSTRKPSTAEPLISQLAQHITRVK